MIARALVLVIAVVACAWFVLGIRQTRDLNDATAIVSHSHALSGAPARHAASLLRAAGQLNPDRAVDLERSRLALREGDPARALALARVVARAEPRNIDAWLTYAASSTGDRAAFSFAYRQLQRLVPPVR